MCFASRPYGWVERSGRITPSRPLRVRRSACAMPFGTYSRSAIAWSTRARLSALTGRDLFRTYETALIETPAAAATSRIVTERRRSDRPSRPVPRGVPRRPFMPLPLVARRPDQEYDDEPTANVWRMV